MEEKNDKSWFSKIESPGEALRELRILVIALRVLGAYNFIFAVYSGHHVFIAPAAGYVLLGHVLQKYKSRCVAKLFLYWAIFIIGIFLAGLIGLIAQNNNLISVLFVLWLAIRSVQVTTAFANPIYPARNDDLM